MQSIKYKQQILEIANQFSLFEQRIQQFSYEIGFLLLIMFQASPKTSPINNSRQQNYGSCGKWTSRRMGGGQKMDDLDQIV